MQPFRNILCAIAADEPSRVTLERAIRLAKNNQARLTIVDTMAPITAGIMPSGKGSFPGEWQAAIKAERLRALQSLTEPHQGEAEIQHEVLAGIGFVEIIRMVLRNGHDLLVKPAENPSFIERIFGSDDIQLLRACPCPVWITYPEEKPKDQKILAAVDIDIDRPRERGDLPEKAINRKILELASSVALSGFSELHVIHAWDAPGENIIRTWSSDPDVDAFSYIQDLQSRHQNGLDALRDELGQNTGPETYEYLSPRFHLRRGSASTKVPEIAQWLQADLVVMGTVARTGIAGLLIGNTAEAILEQLACSVLAVKPPGFVSPVKLDE